MLLLALKDVARSAASSPWKHTADIFLEFLEYNTRRGFFQLSNLISDKPAIV